MADNNNEKLVKAEGLGITILFDLLVTLGLYLAFILTRRVREARIRDYREKMFPDKEPGFFCGLLYWAWKTFWAGPKQFEKRVCIDAQAFLHFERHLMMALGFLTCTVTPTLVILNFMDPVHTSGWPEALYVADAHVGDAFLWTQIACISVVTVTMWFTIFMYRRKLRSIGAHRRIFSPLTCRTLHMSELPKDITKETDAMIHLEKEYGLKAEQVESVHLVPKASGVLSMLKRMDKLSDMVHRYREKSAEYNKMMNDGLKDLEKDISEDGFDKVKNVDGGTTRRCCFSMKKSAVAVTKQAEDLQKQIEAKLKVNPEEYFEKKLDIMYKKLTEKLKKPFKMTGNAFVTFYKAEHAVSFGRTRMFPLVVSPAPEPDDIVWQFMGASFWERTAGRVATYSALLLYLFFVGSPVAIIAIMEFAAEQIGLNLDELIPFGLKNVVTSLALMVISASIPYVVKACTVMELNPSVTELMQSQLRKVVFYNVLVILIFPTASLTSLRAFSETYMDNSRLDMIGEKFLNGTGLFFLIYVIHSSFFPPAFALLRISDVIRSMVFGAVAQTPQERELAAQPTAFNYVMEYSTMLTVLSVILCYGCIIPLIIPFGFLYMCHRYFADRYNLLAVRPAQVGGLGSIPRIVVPIMLYMLVLYQAVMIIFVAYYGDSVQLTVVATLLMGSMCVVIFNFYYFRDGSGFDDMLRGDSDDESESDPLIDSSMVAEKEDYIHPIYRDMRKQSWYNNKLYGAAEALHSARGLQGRPFSDDELEKPNAEESVKLPAKPAPKKGKQRK